jgi:hypothetical protein
VDLNKDGKADILSGSYSRRGGGGMAGLFQVLWGGVDGGFSKPEPLKGTDGKELIIPADDKTEVTKKICTRPVATDWDRDGDLDLLVGNFKGTFYLFRGEGDGKFSPQAEPVMAGGEELQIKGVHSDPFPVDWDGDGDLDLLSGSSNGGVQWAENTAGNGQEPELKQFTELIKPAEERDAGMLDKGQWPATPSGSTRVWVADVNGDGKLDVLLGDSASVQRAGPGLTPEEAEKKFKAWQAEHERLATKLRTARDENGNTDRGLMTQYQNHYQKRGEFMTAERTGFVWLYLRK